MALHPCLLQREEHCQCRTQNSRKVTCSGLCQKSKVTSFLSTWGSDSPCSLSAVSIRTLHLSCYHTTFLSQCTKKEAPPSLLVAVHKLSSSISAPAQTEGSGWRNSHWGSWLPRILSTCCFCNCKHLWVSAICFLIHIGELIILK